MSNLLADLALAVALAMLVCRRRARRRTALAGTTDQRMLGARRWHRVLSVALVIGIVSACVTMPALLAIPASSAAATGLECKDPPAPEVPGETSTDFFDSNAKAARGDGTAYGKYGWAGLVWHTYDLGCGPDVVRAPAAVWDTQLGNAGLAIAKWTAGLAIWLDREAATNANGSSSASTVFGKMDGVVAKGSAALRQAFYDPWSVVAIVVVGIMVLYFALKAAGASAMRKSIVAGIALFLAGLAIGLPTATTHEVDKTFNAAIGRVRDDALRKVGTNPTTGPREAVINQIIIRQWKAGEFGDPDSILAARLSGKLRDAQAMTYDDLDKQDQALKFCKKAGPIVCNFDTVMKKIEPISGHHSEEYTQLANQIKAYGSDAYGQFIGKRENRTSAGWLAALESVVVNALWIAASLLRFVGMLIVRLAVLFAPIWVLAAIVSENVLGRVVRFVGAALFLAVVASAAVAADLVALTGILRTDLSPGWQTFVMLLMSGVIWMVLRPFKRLTQLIGMNHNATVGHAFGRGKRAMAGLLGHEVGKRVGRSDEGDPSSVDQHAGTESLTPQPQEGARRTKTPSLELAAAQTVGADHALPGSTSRRSLPAAPDPNAGADPASTPDAVTISGGGAAARAGLPPGDHTGTGSRSGAGHQGPGAPEQNAASQPFDQSSVRGQAPSPDQLGQARPDFDSADDAEDTAAPPAGKDRRIVTVDEIGRVVDVHDALYDPTEPYVAARWVDEDGEIVHELYSPASEPHTPLPDPVHTHVDGEL